MFLKNSWNIIVHLINIGLNLSKSHLKFEVSTAVILLFVLLQRENSCDDPSQSNKVLK